MKIQNINFSSKITALTVAFDITVIVFGIFLANVTCSKLLLFLVYIVFCWFIISIKNRFYNLPRHIDSKKLRIIKLMINQFFNFSILIYAFLGFFKQISFSSLNIFYYIIGSFTIIFIFKILMYFFITKSRYKYHKDSKRIVIIGNNSKINKLVDFFDERAGYGFDLVKQFNPNHPDFSLKDSLRFISNNKIDKIYFSVAELSNSQINNLIRFSDNNLKELMFVPDSKEVYAKKLSYQFYDYIPVLYIRKIPLDDVLNRTIKRIFDVCFSSLVIIFLLSWLIPIIAIFIKFESKGPIFFKQLRNGKGHSKFMCYKFRSMTINEFSHTKQATKNDARVTKIGKFLRKSSIDELPQFFNVFLGQMSVVGPRPHMVSHTDMYAKKVDKFRVRQLVKPGITGLAQIRGYRGEIEKHQDIVNRVRLDIFYIENWSFILDLKIINLQY